MVRRVEAPSISHTPPVQGPEEQEKTVVRIGENFAQVAERNRISQDDLRMANPGINPNRIQAGQELNLPIAGASSIETGHVGARLDEEARASQIAEHAISGQARAVQLDERLEAVATPPPATGGTPSPPPVTGGTPTVAPQGGTAITQPPSPPISTGTGPAAYHRTLAQGVRGSDVEQLQNDLNQWRTNQGQSSITENGRFGSETRAAVRQFQTANSLQADGIAGSRTTDRLTLENNANFRSLNAQTQQQVRDQMTQYSGTPAHTNDSESRTNLTRLATDPDFARLSREGQDQALRRFATNPADAAQTQQIREGVQDRANLENNANFRNLNADTRQQVLTQMEGFHGNEAARTNLTNLATDPNFSRLSRTSQDQTLQAFGHNSGSEAYTQQLRNLTGSENFRRMDAGLQTRTLQMSGAHAANPDYTQSLDRLVRHEQFGRMSTENQRMTLNVFENTTAAGRNALIGTMDRRINGECALLSRGYGSTGTLLSQMNRLSTTNLDPRLVNSAGQPINRAEVTEQVLRETANPSGEINQSNRGTCTVTSMSRNLAQSHPAEYARLVTDLSTTGSSTLANGDHIEVPAGSWTPDNGTRSHSERLLQTALMHYAVPGAAYSNTTPGPDHIMGTPDDTADQHAGRGVASGLTADEAQHVMQGLHDHNFQIYTGANAADRTTRIHQEIDAGRGPVQVDLNWGQHEGHVGGHAVEVVGYTPDGRVLIRNPWGTDVGPNGVENGTAANNTIDGPRRRTEDQSRGIESMSAADFEAACRRAYLRTPE